MSSHTHGAATMPSDVTHKLSFFDRFASAASRFASRAWFFACCLLLVLLWAPSVVLFPSVDTWQLVINTSTTIITFLMVFLIQNTQNRDTEAMQIKLDELIRVSRSANNALLDLEELEEKELDDLRAHYEDMARQAREMQQAKTKRG